MIKKMKGGDNMTINFNYFVVISLIITLCITVDHIKHSYKK